MLREYRKKDYKPLLDLLELEGESKEDLKQEDFEANPTYILDEKGAIIGFFTYRVERHGYPHLVHFLITKPFRDGIWALKMMKELKQLLREERHKQFIIHAPKKKPEILKIIDWYARRLPYDETVSHRFYLMEA